MASGRVLNFVSKLAIPAAVGVSLIQASLYDVKGGNRAVIFDRLTGVKDTVSFPSPRKPSIAQLRSSSNTPSVKVVNEGTHFLMPWVQKAIIYDVRTKPRNISTTTGSKDLQMVSLTLRVLHRPDVQALPKIYQVRSHPATTAPLPHHPR
jgi:prohibitin 1